MNQSNLVTRTQHTLALTHILKCANAPKNTLINFYINTIYRGLKFLKLALLLPQNVEILLKYITTTNCLTKIFYLDT